MSKASNLAGFITSIVPINNLNIGVATAFKWVGDGLNLTGVGFGSTGNLNTIGVITATKFVGSGIGLTNIGDGGLVPITYSPTIGQTNVQLDSSIVLTFNKPIQVGTGTITLRTDSPSGAIVESFDVKDSDRLSVSGGVLTIDPTSNLGAGTTHYVVLPSGAYKDILNSSPSVGVSTYSFVTRDFTYTLFSWGYNGNGRLGQNNLTQYSSPVQIPGTTWISISSGYQHTLATKSDGTLWSWGYNGNGRLGQNNLTQYSSPVQIPGTTWSSISGSGSHTLATKTDGTLWAFGFNQYGRLGQSNLTAYSSPIQIPGTTWNSISAEDVYGSSFATKTDGTLWAWGRNNIGQLGQNDRTDYSSPRQIPGTTWSSISGCSYSAFATKTDGTLWAWGNNATGHLGQSNLTYYSSPVQIPGTTWSSVSGGFVHRFVLATKTDGTLWSWGYNNFGQLGQNNRTQYSSPVQIPGTNWNFINAGARHSFATKTDGTLWSWGLGYNGRLGQNNTISYSSPVQITGTTWSSISSSYANSLALQQE